LSLGNTSTLRADGRRTISTSPTLRTVPGWTMASLTRAPCTLVPLVEPRSRTFTPPSARVSSQWWRETVSSASTRSLSGALPMRSSSPTGRVVPLALPDSTTAWMPTLPPAGPTARVAIST